MLTDSDTENPRLIQFNCLNIGVGVAKNVTFSFSPSNMEKWLIYLKDKFPSKEYEYAYSNGGTSLDKNGKMLVYKLGGNSYGVPKENKMKYLYFLPDASESYKLSIPVGYLDVIREMFKTSRTGFTAANPIELAIEYDDIQGKHYKKEAHLSIENVLQTIDSDGFGYATYEISMQ
jgi:hypothetical protein